MRERERERFGERARARVCRFSFASLFKSLSRAPTLEAGWVSRCGWTLEEWARAPEYGALLCLVLADGSVGAAEIALVRSYERARGVGPVARRLVAARQGS